MIGAIIGDTVGSIYEFNPIKTTDFPLLSADSQFTDDSVCTIAIADAVLHGTSYAAALQKWGRKYHEVPGDYGFLFRKWLFSENPCPYESYGNGAAMRVSSIGWLFDDMHRTLREARKSAECTHNHPEGIKGAQATAAAIFLARNGKSKAAIKQYIEQKFGYDLNFKIDDIRLQYDFEDSCQMTVPQAIVCYLESDGYENCIRLAVSLGGDADTLACIAGSIAEADRSYSIPDNLLALIDKLPEDMKEIVNLFKKIYFFVSV
jgi:ADP-ribosylglycohydrolase